MANESKKFALLSCCIMTMMALRLVISTAGFCVVRFHIDCELFNIFISRLVNAVMMSQLFGNWLGDLIVFAASGQLKLISIAMANWAEFICFCAALSCFCAGEIGHLTGFYWSMVMAYFWWKVSEAPATSIAVESADYYFAGFTLSGVWAAMLKAVVIRCIGEDSTKSLKFNSEPLGEVNVTVVGDVSVVGTRSVKTTVDYCMCKWLFIVTIFITFLMCALWEMIEALINGDGRKHIATLEELREMANTGTGGNASNNKLLEKIKTVGGSGSQKLDVNDGSGAKTVTLQATGSWSSTQVTVEDVKDNGNDEVTITVMGVPNVTELTGLTRNTAEIVDGDQTKQRADALRTELEKLIEGKWKITGVGLSGTVNKTGQWPLTVKVTTVSASGGIAGARAVARALKRAAKETSGGPSETNNRVLEAIKALGTNLTVDVVEGGVAKQVTISNWGTSAQVDMKSGVMSLGNTITITVTNVPQPSSGLSKDSPIDSGGENTKARADAIKGELEKLVEEKWKITSVTLSGEVKKSANWELTVKVTTVEGSGGIPGDAAVGNALAATTGVVMGTICAVPGALLFSWFGKWCKCGEKAWIIAGAVMGFAAGGGGLGYLAWNNTTAGDTWVPFFKWPKVDQTPVKGKGLGWPAGGLAVGMGLGAFVGLWIGACKGSTKSGTAAGALVGSAFGLWSGEVVNGGLSWKEDANGWNGENVKKNWQQKVAVVVLGLLINVLGCSTVYSVYPGMAPCSITQFKYFNLIDVLILILSSIGPLVIMGLDLADVEWKLGYAIGGSSVGKEENQTARWLWVGGGVLLLIGTNICEILVLSIMQHPHSKMAQDVTTSGWRAVLLTVTMVTCQLVSSGVGFGSVATGSGFNDGCINMNSTAVLWTMECCGVLGEGYLTEIKRYEKGKWPTQGMGKWDTYKWWNRKAFGNAWQIWCCIGTTDLRRDIMLCRQ